MFSTHNHFNILSDLSIALLFHRIICLSASICLFVFFSVCFDVVSLKGQKTVTVSSYLCDISIKCLFRSVFLYMLVCSVCVGGVCVFCVCLCAYHCFFSSDRIKAWPGGNCPYLHIAYWSLCPFSPHVIHRTLLLSTCPNKLCHPPSQDAWDMTLIPSLFPLFPLKKKPCPNIGTSRWKDNIGNATS